MLTWENVKEVKMPRLSSTHLLGCHELDLIIHYATYLVVTTNVRSYSSTIGKKIQSEGTRTAFGGNSSEEELFLETIKRQEEKTTRRVLPRNNKNDKKKKVERVNLFRGL